MSSVGVLFRQMNPTRCGERESQHLLCIVGRLYRLDGALRGNAVVQVTFAIGIRTQWDSGNSHKFQNRGSCTKLSVTITGVKPTARRLESGQKTGFD